MKILSHVDKVSRAVAANVENAFNPIAMRAAGNPQMLTYYSIDNTHSHYEPGFTDLGELIGPASEIRYKRIKNLMAVAFQDITFDDVFLEEMGNNIEVSASCQLFIDTVRPQPGDLFTVNILTKPFIFVVNSTKSNSAYNEPMYYINFSLKTSTQEKFDQLQKQITAELVMTAHKFGDQQSFVIEETKYYDNKKFVEDAVAIIEMYRTLFFDDMYSSFSYQLDKFRYIDWMVHMFMYSNRVIVMDEIQVHGNSTYHQSNHPIFIEPPMVEKFVYDHTFYGRYLNKALNKEMNLFPSMMDVPSQKQNCIGQNNRIIDTYTEVDGEEIPRPYFTQEFIDRIKAGTIITDTSDVHRSAKNLIIKYYNGTIIDADFEALELHDTRSLDNYYLIPLVVYIYRTKLLM